MHSSHHPTAMRIAALLHKAGIHTQIIEFDSPTRTSAEAAVAIGCQIGQIAKSVVFRGAHSDQVIIVVTSGGKRVAEDKVASMVGEPLTRADASFVRNSTGYAIGGVAPFDYPQPVRMLLDQNLRQYSTVWAAAGTPFTMFAVTPDELSSLVGESWSDVTI